MLVHRARDGADRLLDFFVAVPGERAAAGRARRDARGRHRLRRARRRRRSCIGPAAVAVPGDAGGPRRPRTGATRRLPWPELLAPAIELARAGVPLNAGQAFLHEILDADPPQRARGPADLRRATRPLGRGGARGHGRPRRDARAAGGRGRRRLLPRRPRPARERGRASGGRSAHRAPTSPRTASSGADPSAPPTAATSSSPTRRPSSGGLLIAFALRVLDRLGPPPAAGSPDGDRARWPRPCGRRRGCAGPGSSGELYRGGAARRLLADERVAEAAAAVRARGVRQAAPEPSALPSTTHISVVDGKGNAASLSASTGCGSGVRRPGHGRPDEQHARRARPQPARRTIRPGARLTSMMAPSIVLGRRAAAARRRQRRLDPAPRRDPADRRATWSTTG